MARQLPLSSFRCLMSSRALELQLLRRLQHLQPRKLKFCPRTKRSSGRNEALPFCARPGSATCARSKCSTNASVSSVRNFANGSIADRFATVSLDCFADVPRFLAVLHRCRSVGECSGDVCRIADGCRQRGPGLSRRPGSPGAFSACEVSELSCPMFATTPKLMIHALLCLFRLIHTVASSLSRLN